MALVKLQVHLTHHLPLYLQPERNAGNGLLRGKAQHHLSRVTAGLPGQYISIHRILKAVLRSSSGMNSYVHIDPQGFCNCGEWLLRVCILTRIQQMHELVLELPSDGKVLRAQVGKVSIKSETLKTVFFKRTYKFLVKMDSINFSP